MGKEREEQVAMVRAVLGEGTPEMDIIRALHMAGDDPTKAINILLDFNHKAAAPLPPTPSPSPSPSPSPPPGKPAPTRPMPTAEKPKPVTPTTNGGGGDHWWLVGSAEMAGLSTCKGRRIASGDAVTFTFPNATAAVGKSRPGRPALASCSSEIMRFSTPSHGEVHYFITAAHHPILDTASGHCMNILLLFRWVASPMSGQGASFPFSRRTS
jgi:DNA repair protein RAD5